VLDLPADSTVRTFTLAEPSGSGVSGAYFVDLRLTDAGGRVRSTNFYWLSTRPDVLADTSTWYMTPVKSFADFTALRDMPRAAVKVSTRLGRSAPAAISEARVTLANPGKSVAFFLRLQVIGSDGKEALPVLWDDNYVSLLGGETRVVTARYRSRDIHGAPRVVVQGWNVPRTVAR
jgi:exo-1,4-beta-D-glucosaminidase